MAKLVSLNTVSVVINNPNYEQIVIGGNGQMVGSITMSRNESAFGMTGSPDGGYAASFSRNRTGSISIDISQASSLIGRLRRFISWCEANPNLAESSITVMDSLGNLKGYANGVFPDKLPDNTVSDSIGTRTFQFLVGEIEFEEGDE